MNEQRFEKDNDMSSSSSSSKVKLYADLGDRARVTPGKESVVKLVVSLGDAYNQTRSNAHQSPTAALGTKSKKRCFPHSLKTSKSNGEGLNDWTRFGCNPVVLVVVVVPYRTR